MNTILTDDERRELRSEHGWALDTIKLIEAAVLAKLREQEPVGNVRGAGDRALANLAEINRRCEALTKLHDRAAFAAPLPAVVQVPVAWVWNPASQDWEKVRAPGHWQQGAIYAFGPAAPEAPAQGDGLEFVLEQLVNACNQSADACNWSETISAEAALERLYKARKAAPEAPATAVVQVPQITDAINSVRDAVIDYLDELEDDAIAHIWPNDLKKCQTSECVVKVASVRMGSPEEHTIPLFSLIQVREAFATMLAAAPEAQAKADHTELLRVIAHRAKCFPGYPLGHHIPEVFAAIGEEPPQPEAPATAVVQVPQCVGCQQVDYCKNNGCVDAAMTSDAPDLPAQPSVPAPWREAVKRLRKNDAAGDTVFRCGFNAGIDAAIALADSLEGGE